MHITKNATIPNTVTNINYGAFINCTSLESITIPHGVSSIDVDVFSGCSSLKNITIPDSVSYIGDNAFLGCGLLNVLNIPNESAVIGTLSSDTYLYQSNSATEISSLLNAYQTASIEVVVGQLPTIKKISISGSNTLLSTDELRSKKVIITFWNGSGSVKTEEISIGNLMEISSLVYQLPYSNVFSYLDINGIDKSSVAEEFIVNNLTVAFTMYVELTVIPTPEATSSPSPELTVSPIPEDTVSPTPEPTAIPTPEPTETPIIMPEPILVPVITAEPIHINYEDIEQHSAIPKTGVKTNLMVFIIPMVATLFIFTVKLYVKPRKKK